MQHAIAPVPNSELVIIAALPFFLFLGFLVITESISLTVTFVTFALSPSIAFCFLLFPSACSQLLRDF